MNRLFHFQKPLELQRRLGVFQSNHIPPLSDLPRVVERKLLLARRQRTVRRAKIVAMLAATCFLLLMILVMRLDWSLTPSHPWYRVAITAVPIAALLVVAVGGAAVYVLPGRSLVEIARHVDRSIPELEERWSSLAGAQRHSNSRASVAMFDQLRAESTALEPLVEPDRLTRSRAIPYVTAGLIAAALGFVMFVVAYRNSAPTLLYRYMFPLQACSLTKVDLPFRDIVIPRDESLLVEATLRGKQPTSARLWVRDQQADPQQIPLTLEANLSEGTARLRYEIPARATSFDYRVTAGDGVSPWIPVRVVERPDFRQVELRIASVDGRVVDERSEWPSRVRVDAGSTLQLRWQTNVPLSEMKLQFAQDQASSLSADADGWYRFDKQLVESIDLLPRMVDTHGIDNRKAPVCHIDVIPDRPPVVTVTSTPDSTVEVIPDGSVEIAFTARDDRGIAKAELVVYDESQLDTRGEPLVLHVFQIDLTGQANAPVVDGKARLDLKSLGLKDTEDVSVGIRVYDVNEAIAEPGTNEPSRSESEPAMAGTMPAETVSDNSAPSADPPAATDASASSTASAPPSRSDSKDQAQDSSTASAARSPQRPNEGTSKETKPPLDAPPQQASRKSEAPTPKPSGLAADPATTDKSRPGMKPPSPTQKLGQQAESKRIALVIDENAGRYDGQLQRQLRESIDAEFQQIAASLQAAADLAEESHASSSPSAATAEPNRSLLQQADTQLKRVEAAVTALQRLTAQSPYEFTGDQMTQIGRALVTPAREIVAIAVDRPDGDEIAKALDLLRDAQKRVEDLRGRYDQAKMDERLSDSLQEIKKMYAIYLNEAFQLMSGAAATASVERKPIEYELDEEYLKRLTEVYELRMKLLAEFAKMLAEDPRLMARYADFLRQRSETLLTEVANLQEEQLTLMKECRAWSRIQEPKRELFIRFVAQRKLEQAADLLDGVEQLGERFQAQLPLNVKLSQSDVVVVRDQLSDITATMKTWLPALATDSKTTSLPELTLLQNRVDESNGVLQQLRELKEAVARVRLEGDRNEMSEFIPLRLADVDDVAERTEIWKRNLEQLIEQEYTAAAEVDQHQLYIETNLFAGRLASLDTQLSGLFGQGEASVPAEITALREELEAVVVDQGVMHQLAATYGLKQDKIAEAVSQQLLAAECLGKAGRLLNEIVRRVVKELDKLPPGAPPNLEDPRLEDLLALLERELDLEELLGIPPRPTNIMAFGLSSRSGQQMSMLQQNQADRNQRLLEQRLRDAKKRAEARKVAATDLMDRSPDENRWNTLVSKLTDDLQQQRGELPPEEYRQAIEQYFERISKLVSEKE